MNPTEKIQILLNRRAARESLRCFLDQIIIPASPEPKRFGDCADPWQREKVAPLIPALEHLMGRNKGYVGPMRFMSILARGHNKSSEEAWLATALVLSSKRLIEGYVLAADRDQGRLIVNAVRDLLALNEWMNSYVKITRDVVSGPGGNITVLPCDARSSMGLRGNFYIADETVHWKRQGEWNALVTGLRKVTPCVFCVLSNAGLLGSWQHEAFLDAQRDPEWSVFYRKGILASWLDPAGIARDRRLIPPSEAERLYDNEWIDPAAEHDYLRRSEVEACVDPDLMFRLRRQVGVSNYVAAIDYGPRRDRTALVVCHCDKAGVVVVDRLEAWQGSSDKPVLIADVEKWIDDVRKAFSPVCWVIDPYQMEGTIQRMQRDGLPVEPFKSRAGAGNYEMAQHLRALIVERRLRWYTGAGVLGSETFADELTALRVKKMSYGYRFDHENQKHDDRCLIAGTMIETEDGPRRIESVAVGTPVLTRVGYRPVVASGETGARMVYGVSFEDGARLVGTQNHPVFTARGWVDLGDLQPGDEAYTWSKHSSTADESTADTQSRNIGTIGSTSSVTTTGKQPRGICTGICGRTLTGRFRPNTTYTTRTETRSTTPCRTWNAFRKLSTLAGTGNLTERSDALGSRPRKGKSTRRETDNDCDGCKQTQPDMSNECRWLSSLGSGEKKNLSPASCAESLEPLETPRAVCTAPMPVVSVPTMTGIGTRKTERAPSAGSCTGQTSTVGLALVPRVVLRVSDQGIRRVYNLSVADQPEYFANGTLVHNCVAIGMAAMSASQYPPDGVTIPVKLLPAVRTPRFVGDRLDR